MVEMSNIDKLKNIFADVFEEKVENISENSSMDTIEKWDSLGMINLVSVIENQFEVEFDILEIADLKTFSIIKLSLEEKGVKF